jgi:hypothetical protein
VSILMQNYYFSPPILVHAQVWNNTGKAPFPQICDMQLKLVFFSAC